MCLKPELGSEINVTDDPSAGEVRVGIGNSIPQIGRGANNLDNWNRT